MIFTYVCPVDEKPVSDARTLQNLWQSGHCFKALSLHGNSREDHSTFYILVYSTYMLTSDYHNHD